MPFFSASFSALSFLLATGSLFADTPIPYETEFKPGSLTELRFFRKSNGAVITPEGVRHANVGQFLFYAFPAIPGSIERLRLTLEDANAPTVIVLTAGNKPLILSLSRLADGTLSLQWTNPATLKRGDEILVGLSAKTLSFGIKSVRYLRVDADSDNDGISEFAKSLMLEGQPTETKLTVRKAGTTPAVFAVTDSPPTPEYDFGSEGILGDAALSSLWRGRGATVWSGFAGTSLSSPETGKIPSPNSASVQSDFRGNALEWNGKPALAPTPDRFAFERSVLAGAVNAGAEGVILPEPFYFATAGYESVFRDAWAKIYNKPWADPRSGMEPRWLSGKLMSNLLTTYTSGLSQEVARLKPSVRRVLSVPNPLSAASHSLISPVYRLVSQPAVQDVLSEANPGTPEDATLRLNGAARRLPFSLSYLKASALTQIVRGTGKRLTLQLPENAEAEKPLTEDLANALTASLMFPDALHFSLSASRKTWENYSGEGKTQFASLLSLLTELSENTRFGGEANPNNGNEIGVLLSETAQWQREAPFPSDLDGLYGLTLPLLQRGVPVQIASLDRADNPDTLKPFKTLLLSYDFQKPLEENLQTGLANWVKRGGSLIFFGGSDPYNQTAAGWWQKANKNAPQDSLFSALGIPVGTAVTQFEEAEDLSKYALVTQGDVRTLTTIEVDVTRFATTFGSVAVRLTPASADEKFTLSKIEIVIGGKTAAAFRAGSDLENRLIRYESGTKIEKEGEGRTFSGAAFVTYGVDNLPIDTKILLRLTLQGAYRVEATSAKPNDTHVLIGEQGGGDIPKSLPRLRVGANYPLTFYPDFPVAPTKKPSDATAPSSQDEKENEPIPLYGLRSGGIPVWMQAAEKGTLLYVGVSPGYFSSSERSAALLRALVEYAHQRAGAKYSEPGALVLKRGRFVIVKTFGEQEILDGRTIDVLSSSLNVTADRVIAPNSLGIYALLEPTKTPKIGFVAGQVKAKTETSTHTAYFVRGAKGTTGIARIDTDGRKLTGARATNAYGDPVALSSEVQGSTVFLKYVNDPDGVIVRLGWQ